MQFSRELGRGAFGEVWEGTAEDIMGPGTGTHRVAIKVCYHSNVFARIYVIIQFIFLRCYRKMLLKLTNEVSCQRPSS